MKPKLIPGIVHVLFTIVKARASVASAGDMLHHLTHLVILIGSLSFASSRKHVDLNRCYSKHCACFGILNGIRSVGNVQGCIKDDNCNILLFAEMKSEGHQTIFQFTLVSRWSRGLSQSLSRFSISRNKEPFHKLTGYIEAEVKRSRTAQSWNSFVAFMNRQENVLSGDYSGYYHFHHEFTESESLVTFRTKENKLYGLNYNLDLMNDQVFIHLQYDEDSSSKEKASTDIAIKLFENKQVANPPFHTRPTTIATTSTFPATATTTTQRPIIVSTELKTTTTSVPSQTYSAASGTKSDPTKTSKAAMNTTLIVVIVFAILLAVTGIVLTGTYLYCAKGKRQKIKVKKQKNEKVDKKQNQQDIINRIRGEPTLGNSPGL